MRTPWLSVVLLTVVAAASGQPLALNVMPATRTTAAAGEVAVDVVALNRGTSPAPFELPPTLTGSLRIGAESWPVELHANDGKVGADPSDLLASTGSIPATTNVADPRSVEVAGGSFALRTYVFSVPVAAHGPAVLEVIVPGYASIRGVVETTRVTASPAASSEASSPRETVQKPTTNLARAQPAAAALKRTFANRLAAHEPIYFIYGGDAPAAKFQFSFKYKLLNFSDETSTMARTLQFAFTQRSLWDIQGDSSPFYDTSYMPEFIFESLALTPEKSDRWFTWLGYQAAYKHESNGRDGLASRSLNSLYLRSVVALGALDGWHLLVMPELFTYIDSLENNPEIDEYRGYGQLRLVFGRNDGPSLMATLWAGKKLEHRSVQLDLTWPVRTQLLQFETYFLIQYYNGFGESLRDYRDKTETVRAGILLVR